MRTAGDLTSDLVGFARALRSRGVTVGTGQVARYCEAAPLLGVTDAEDLYWAGRCCLLTRAEDIPVYDDEFARFFLGAGSPMEEHREDRPGHGAPRPDGPPTAAVAGFGGEPGAAGEDARERARSGAAASAEELLRTRSFSSWTGEELALLPTLLASLRVAPPDRETRRSRPAPTGDRLDLRRSVRRSLRHEGELLARAWRVRRRRPRPVVMLVDISGSMAEHSRALLHFAYALVASGLRVEVFSFGTRLTRLTDLLAQRDPDRAVAAASAAAADWAGGTRIGDSLAEFIRGWAGRGVLRGGVVLVFSDGLERGDPAALAAAMDRLGRLAHAVVWLNPLQADPSYRPLARGMQAALPHIDHLLAADDLEDLHQIAALVRRLV